MKKAAVIILSLISIALACTSAIISGSATIDGRPILWKHRDTGSMENKIVFVSESGYDFMGVANAIDTTNKEIWMGMNETGFSIMNTASYNINEGISCDLEDDQEGLFMRLALERCAGVDDFEQLLKDVSGKWGIDANFGVIDAQGNAAYFETGYYDYTKYDVNDPETAPNGYLIRTNFSVSGGESKGQGYIRYEATHRLFEKQNTLSVEFIIKEATRNMDHGVLKEHIGNMKLPRNKNDKILVAFQDYIVRYWSASVLVIQGVKHGEDPQKTMLWPIMGFPLTAMATPVFYASHDALPEVISSENGCIPFMAEASMTLKAELFPVQHDDHENYIDVAKLKNRKKTGVMQIMMKKEDEIIRRAKAIQATQKPEEIQEYYNWLDNYVRSVYRELLPPKPDKETLPGPELIGEEGICR